MRDLHLDGWHDDGAVATKEKPGRLHEHSSAQKRHEQKRREISHARRARNKSITQAATMFAARKLAQRRSRSGEDSGGAAVQDLGTACRV